MLGCWCSFYIPLSSDIPIPVHGQQLTSETSYEYLLLVDRRCLESHFVLHIVLANTGLYVAHLFVQLCTLPQPSCRDPNLFDSEDNLTLLSI